MRKFYTPLEKGQIITSPDWLIEDLLREFPLLGPNADPEARRKAYNLHFGFAGEWTHNLCFDAVDVEIETFKRCDPLDRRVMLHEVLEDDKVAMFKSSGVRGESFTIGKTEHPEWNDWLALDPKIDIALNCFQQTARNGYSFEYIDTVSFRHLNRFESIIDGKQDTQFFWKNSIIKSTLRPERRQF